MIVTFSDPVESVRGKIRIGKGYYVKKMYGKYVLQRCPNRKGHIPTKKEKENQKKFIKQWKKRKKDAEVPKDVIEALKELCIFDWEQCP